MEILNVPKSNLLGHSMGGAVVALFAGIFPELVEKLVLIDSMGPISMPEGEIASEIQEEHRGCYCFTA